ncbi:MAG: polysaccharide deacetylase family protein [Pseudomonadota bacterium]
MKQQPRIYMLHRIIEHFDESNYYFQRKTAISWLKFIELIDLIEKKGWKTRCISSLVQGYTDNDVFLTFDDGYKDNSSALDELIRRGMTATVYPVKNFTLTNFSPIDDMAHHLMATPNVAKNLLSSLLDGRLKRVLRRMSASRYRYFRKHWFSIDIDANNADLFMQEKQLKRYSSQGIELGIHGRSHRTFNHLTSSELSSELSDCLNWLCSLGNVSSTSLCFPHGKHSETVIKQSQSIVKIMLGVDCDTLLPPVLKRIHVTEDYNV